jgi:hypothetical protein
MCVFAFPVGQAHQAFNGRIELIVPIRSLSILGATSNKTSNKSMSRRRSLARLSSIDSYCLAGFGQGEGAAYKPWLRVQDIPSLGRVHRVKGWKHGRVHHLLSDLEARVFFIYEWSLQIIDIREQYPLLPLDETLAIAKECGVAHPTASRHR